MDDMNTFYDRTRMSSKLATFDDAQPLELVTVLLDGKTIKLDHIEITIQSKINEHIVADIQGLISDDTYEQYLWMAHKKTKLTIIHKIADAESLKFEGVITNISISLQGAAVTNAVYHLHLTAMSCTYLLDIKKQDQSFQDNQMSYDTMIKKLLSDFDGADFMNNAAEGKQLSAFILQYHDTAWEFLIREASKFEQGLFADATSSSPKFQFGLPKGVNRGDLEEYEYTISKQMDLFHVLNENGYESGLNHLDLIEYLLTDRFASTTFSIGDIVTYQNKALYISKILSRIRDHKLYNTYTLTTKNALKMPRLSNGDLQGLALPGRILDVKENQLKIHLEIDTQQDTATATWFHYATWHATWYCMPEVGDFAYLYFPNQLEYHSFILNSMKQSPDAGYIRNNTIPMRPEFSGQSINGQTEPPVIASSGAPTTASPVDFAPMANNNKIKMLTTKDGKTIALGEDLIIIDNNQGSYIELHDGGGITVYTLKDLQLYAEKDIAFNCKETLTLQAEKEVKIECEASVVTLTPEKIVLKGTDLDMN